MKIACFTDTYLPKINGISFSVDAFSRLLSQEGNEVEIYAPAVEPRANYECSDGITVRRFYSVPIPTYKEVRIAVPDVAKIINLVEKFDPDIFHIHSPGSLGLVGLLIAKILKKPVVGTYHTLISEMLVYASPDKLLGKYIKPIENVFDGIGVGSLTLKKEKEETTADSIPQKLTWSLVNRFYGYCDIVITPSAAIKRELVKRGVRNRIEVVSNGVDLKLFPTKEYSQLTGRIIHAGRLGFEKNVNMVIKAFGRLVVRYPDWRMVVAGDGPARKDLQIMSREFGLEKQIEFLGMVPRVKLGEIYRSGDVFATASTMETQGMVVLEAMACGLPVVGVDKFALPDLVQDGINGFIVKPGDDQQMAEMLEEIMTNFELQVCMGKKSYEIAQEHEIKMLAKKLSNLYESAIPCGG